MTEMVQYQLNEGTTQCVLFISNIMKNIPTKASKIRLRKVLHVLGVVCIASNIKMDGRIRILLLLVYTM